MFVLPLTLGQEWKIEPINIDLKHIKGQVHWFSNCAMSTTGGTQPPCSGTWEISEIIFEN